MGKATTAVATTGDNPFGGLAKIGGSVADMTPMTPAGPGVTYVSFFTTKAKKAGEIQQALPGIMPGQPYLSKADSGFQKLSNLKFHLIDRAQHWVLRDGDNNPIKATKTQPTGASNLRENIEALILVYTDDGKVVPALATFNTAKSHVGRTANDAIAAAMEPDWFNKSPDHKATAQIPDPRFRFTTSVRSWVAPAKGSGFPTVNARGTIKPTTPGELSLVNEATKDPQFGEEMEVLRKSFTSKVEQLDKLSGESQ